jgi:zinc transport system substrate-binding protein
MRNNTIFIIVFLVAIALAAAVLFWAGTTQDSTGEDDQRINAIVSILPQREFVRAVGEDQVSVKVLIPPGSSPATYDLSPQDLIAIEEADVYFRIGHVPFEKSHMDQIKSVNPKLIIIDTSESVPLRFFGSDEEYGHEGAHENSQEGEEHDNEGADPHIWLSPALVKLQVESIHDALAGMDAENSAEYRLNADAYISRLNDLDADLEEAFKELDNNVLLVFHPAWGYFADEYGLEQIAIERGGKEPTASELQAIIDTSKRENVKVIFVQAQFDKSIAESVAEEIGVVVVQIDPLAENYVENLRGVGEAIIENL